MSNNSSCGNPNILAGQGLTVASSGSWSCIELDLPCNTDFKQIKERLSVIEKRLAILEPDQDLQDKYPALQEAYDHYKLIEKLVESKSENST